jgi:hypothetical protein
MHEVAVADDDRLAGQSVAWEAGQENCGRGDVFQGSEFAIDCFAQHDVFDNFLFSYPKLLRLLRDLFLDQRGTNKSRANDV